MKLATFLRQWFPCFRQNHAWIEHFDVRLGVNRVTLTARRSLPVFPVNLGRYLFERRQAAGAVPNAFLKARENAASEP